MKRKRGRPSVVSARRSGGFHRRGEKMEVGDIADLGIEKYDKHVAGRNNATMLRDFIPSRLPAESADIAKDIILSVAYGCGGWSTFTSHLIDRPPSRMTADAATISKLNRLRKELEFSGYTYDVLRAMLLVTEGGE